MSPRDLRLAALVAIFAPARAARLLGRLAGSNAGPGATLAGRLAVASKGERIGALAQSFAQQRNPARASVRVDSLVSAERARIRRALQSLLPPDLRPTSTSVEPGGGVAPVLVRACAEQIARALR